ncbi:hypothetical protein Afil01_56480 [Actinorhabdospora filicis]|uniref:Glycine-rich domain-containing protein n=1 Tax=Actinorhabdospora filicis TaxID=1785913 RepID=A0A9W6WCQ7_9ACTN|nr:hypothetical protein [Actinorhabdospora filicis]GLZ80841.1 hypothetical protein Afil01_56480 [Actinorhabdospora filicis]
MHARATALAVLLALAIAPVPARAAVDGGVAEFTASGTFTVPAKVTRVQLQLWGGGGGGSGRRSGTLDSGTPEGMYNGNGGGGGGYTFMILTGLTQDTVLGVNLGPGGPGGPREDMDGAVGGPTFVSIGELRVALAGGGDGATASGGAGAGGTGSIDPAHGSGYTLTGEAGTTGDYDSVGHGGAPPSDGLLPGDGRAHGGDGIGATGLSGTDGWALITW